MKSNYTKYTMIWSQMSVICCLWNKLTAGIHQALTSNIISIKCQHENQKSGHTGH